MGFGDFWKLYAMDMFGIIWEKRFHQNRSARHLYSKMCFRLTEYEV